MWSPGGEGRAELANCLRARISEIQQAVLARVSAISDSQEVADPTYSEGLELAVLAALEYGLAGVETGGEGLPPIPDVLLSQARLAARNGVSLDTVLRRYFAGYALLGDVLIEELEDRKSFGEFELKGLLRAQAALFDRLLAAVGEEHARETRRVADSPEWRRAEQIERLLNGEPLQTAELDYDFAAHHLGVIAAGLEAEEVIRRLAKQLDCRLLLVPRGEGPVWGWLGSRRPVDPERMERHVSEHPPDGAFLAAGEPAMGIAGWRLTHRQARAVLPIALRGRQALVRYVEEALLASVLQDDVLTSSLRQLYLSPLVAERDGGQAFRATLRAYFAADRNVSSAAAALGVSRQTVVNRLRAIEERIRRPLSHCAAEVEAALRLADLDDFSHLQIAKLRTRY